MKSIQEEITHLTHPKALLRLTVEWSSIIVWCRSAVEANDGWICYGVTYSNCQDIPSWHTEPLSLHKDEVEVCLRLRYGGKSET